MAVNDIRQGLKKYVNMWGKTFNRGCLLVGFNILEIRSCMIYFSVER